MASELGTMRISEQIDALEIMGVSTPAYLIGPKIIASIFVMPILIIIALALGIVGGWLAGLAGGFFSTMEYKRGLQDGVENYELIIMLLKAVVFGFLISSVSCFHGFYVRGGALEIGAASTRAVVQSSIMIIVANFLIAFLFL
jgi:phospholipid/cholesterol/gamma-HCH transport system permease protein